MADVAIRSTGKWDFRKAEFLIFGITIFIAKSLLLVRLPYRRWDTNALFTGLILLSFYLYFRFRYKLVPPAIILFFLAAAVAVDVLGNAFNLYRLSAGELASEPILDEAGNVVTMYIREPWPVQYDEISHLLGSGFSLPPAMWLLRASTRRFGLKLPLDLLAFLSVTITFSFCSYYEMLELWDEQFYGGKRLWSPQDTPNDLQWNLAGIILAALLSALVFKIVDRHEEAKLNPA